MEFTKFKETDYDLVCFGKKHVIVHYGINYDFLKTLSDVDKAEYICNIMSVNDLVQFTVKVPDDYGETVIGSK